MKNIFNIKTLFFVALTSLIFTSCTDDDYQKEVEVKPDLTAGAADFSNYVAVGNSLTAGYTDGALFMKGQEDSMPNILATKFGMIGGGTFTQPLMGDNIGGMLAGGNVIQEPRLYLGADGPARLDATPTTELFASTPGPYNNMGVPGAKVAHLLYDGYGNPANLGVSANPYFVRMASSSSASVIADAAGQSPTFFSLWIGSNDVLKYAMAGADSNLEAVTPAGMFDTYYNMVVDAMTGNGAKGVLVNIVDVTTVPFFTTVPFNPVPLDEATANVLNGAFAQYNGGVQQVLAGYVAASVITQSAYSIPNYRQATAEDLLVLPSKSFIGTLAVPGNPQYVNGVSVPLADKWVLTSTEQEEINIVTDGFNATIQAAATNKGLGYGFWWFYND